VLDNVRDATAAGCRRLLLATTGWQADADEVVATLRGTGAVAVAAPNLSIGAAVFLRLVEAAARLTAATGGFEPSVVEWHRRAKADRPSGTAHEIVRRLAPWTPIAVDEVAVVRSGWMPGQHAVAFDGPSETLELRLTSRNRSGYAAGALLAIDWLRAASRSPGIHPFDEVIDELFEPTERLSRDAAMPV
jgi:4-hydroxy-tetrahydrodipicolinate reductase